MMIAALTQKRFHPKHVQPSPTLVSVSGICYSQTFENANFLIDSFIKHSKTSSFNTGILK